MLHILLIKKIGNASEYCSKKMRLQLKEKLYEKVSTKILIIFEFC